MSDTRPYGLVVIGGSAGALQPLKTILKSLPRDFPLPVVVVIHIAPETPLDIMRSIVGSGPLPGDVAADGDAIEPGRVYAAPPNRHLLIRPGRFAVVHGPHENRVRPSLDPTFRTAARIFDGHAIAVILSGGLSDGSYGAMVIKSRSGIVIAQEPTECENPSMPRAAIRHASVDFVEPVARIAPRLVEISRQFAGLPASRQPLSSGSEVDEMEAVSSRERLPFGELSPFICPECNGPLWVKEDGTLSHFRCHEGHAYTGEVLVAHQTEELEAALWTAVRSLDEHALLLRKLSETSPMADDFMQRADDTEAKAALIRDKLLL